MTDGDVENHQNWRIRDHSHTRRCEASERKIENAEVERIPRILRDNGKHVSQHDVWYASGSSYG